MDEFFNMWYTKAGALGVAMASLWVVVKVFYAKLSRDAQLAETKEATRAEQDKKDKEALTAEIKAVRDKHEKSLEANADRMERLVVNNTLALQACAATQHENALSREKLDCTIQELSSTLRQLPCNSRDFRTPRPP